MASQFEELLDHLVLGNKLRVPADSINIGSFRTAFARYAKDNILVGARKLDVKQDLGTDGNPIYVIGLVSRDTRKPIVYEVIQNESK